MREKLSLLPLVGLSFILITIAAAPSEIHIPGSATFATTSGSVGIGTTNPTEKLTLTDGTFKQTLTSPPQLVKSLALGSVNGWSIEINGHYAYIGEGGAFANEFRIYDISNPASPKLLNTTYLGDNVDINALATNGDYLYVGTETRSGDEFLIYDVRNHAAPTKVGGLELGDQCYTIALHGKYAYIGADTNVIGGDELMIIDITDPTTPKKIGGVNTGAGVRDITIHGNLLYLGNGGVSGTCSGTTLAGCEFRIYDTSDPTNPQPVGGKDQGQTIKSIIVKEPYAYVQLGLEDTGGTCSGTDVSSCEFFILNISDPNNPTGVAGFDGGKYRVYSHGGPTIIVTKDYAYINSVNASGGVIIINITNPTTPTVITTIPTPQSGCSIALTGNHLYVGLINGADDLRIYQLHGIESPAASIGAVSTDQLDVNGPIRANTINARTSLTIGPGGLYTQGATSIHVNHESNASALTIINNASQTILTILGNGSTGINTASPDSGFHVNGTITIIGNQTWEIPQGDSEVCFERFVGTISNYSRCINSSGQVVEKSGQFPV